MSDKYENIIECENCHYRAEKEKWSILVLSDTVLGNDIFCTALEFIPKTNKHKSRGVVQLLSCPFCKMVFWEK